MNTKVNMDTHYVFLKRYTLNTIIRFLLNVKRSTENAACRKFKNSSVTGLKGTGGYPDYAFLSVPPMLLSVMENRSVKSFRPVSTAR